MRKYICILLICVASKLCAQDYLFPLSGDWFVHQGGDTINVNHHMGVQSQWYGLDLVKIKDANDRSLHVGAGKKLTDYYSYGQEVIAPVSGEIFIAHDGEVDNEIGETDEKNVFGNHVVIKTEQNVYVYLAHFKKGSLKVVTGAKVEAGHVLGLIGNSGNTSMPHLHMHVQDKPAYNTGTGLVMNFKDIDVTLSGKEFKSVTWPLTAGLFVCTNK